jgi:WD40 repeat protein
MIWNITNGSPIKRIMGHDSYVISIMFSPDSKQIASTSDDESIRIFEVSNGN